jgi:hypothetical protein
MSQSGDLAGQSALSDERTPWWQRLIPFPDMGAAIVRFPAPILVAAAATLMVIGDELNLPFFSDIDDDWLESALLLFFSSLLPTLFLEARRAKAPFAALAGFLGLAVAACWWFLPGSWGPDVDAAAIAAAVAVAMLCGVAAFSLRQPSLDPFWIWHQRAILHGIFAVVGAGILVVGLIAIERSLDLLFGVDLNDLVVEIILPAVFLFLVPVSWLAALAPVETLPDQIGKEDSVILRGISILARFIAVPLLAVYAALLIAYGVKIALESSLPQNQIGWMVTAFGTTGAAAILALYPDRNGANAFVRLFWRWWFPVTLLPLALLAIALWQRISIYGLTEERVLLAAGFAWLTLLAIVFTAMRGARDIRLISGLAGVLLLAVSVGPLNFEALSVRVQTTRFLAAAERVDADQAGEADLRSMKGALDYLRGHRIPDAVATLATSKGFASEDDTGTAGDDRRVEIARFLQAHYELDQVEVASRRPSHMFLSLGGGGAVEVSPGLRLHGPLSLRRAHRDDAVGEIVEVTGLSFSLEESALVVQGHGQRLAIDLESLFRDNGQRNRSLDEMVRVVSLGGRAIQIIVLQGTMRRDPASEDDGAASDGQRLSELTFFVITPDPD